jgi:hypothetical protein
MSLAQLTNAPFLNAVCNSVKCNQVVSEQVICNDVYATLGTWATGQINFLATNIPSVNLEYFILNNIVTLNVQLPLTTVGASSLISFTNLLPTEIRPQLVETGCISVLDTSTLTNSQIGTAFILSDGTFSIILSSDSVDNDVYRISGIVQYPL